MNRKLFWMVAVFILSFAKITNAQIPTILNMYLPGNAPSYQNVLPGDTMKFVFFFNVPFNISQDTVHLSGISFPLSGSISGGDLTWAKVTRPNGTLVTPIDTSPSGDTLNFTFDTLESIGFAYDTLIFTCVSSASYAALSAGLIVNALEQINPDGFCSAYFYLSSIPIVASFAFSGLPVCYNGQVGFTNNSTGNNLKYIWLSGTIPIYTGDILPPMSASALALAYGITLEATDTVLNYSVYSPVGWLNTLPVPYPSLTPSGPTTFCDGDSITITTGTYSSYLWLPDSQTTQSIVVKETKNITVRVKGTNGCYGTSPFTIHVQTKYTPSIPTISTNGYCELSTPFLNSAFSNAWFLNGNFISADTAITTNINGTYKVVTNDSDGCSTTSVPFNFSVPFVASVTAGGSTSFCDGSNVNLSATPNADTYAWSNGDSTQNITATSPGSYTVTVTKGGCISTPPPISISVANWVIPSVLITSSPINVIPGQPAIFTASAVNGGLNPGFQWYRNSILIPGAVDSQYTGVLNSGEWIAAVLHTSAPCALVSDVISNDIAVSVPAGANSFAIETDNVNVWPNPTNNGVTVQTSFEIEKVELINMTGQVIEIQPCNTKKTTINFSGVPPGIYFLRVNDLHMNKIIKE